MAFDINVFYNVLRSIYDDYSAKEQAVKFDVDLSDSGRQKKLDKINSDRKKAVSQLQETYQKEFDKSMAVIDKSLNGKKENVKEKAVEFMNTRLVKDFNLSTYTGGDPIIDDNSRTALILDSIASTHKERMDFARQQALSQGNESWYRTQLDSGMTKRGKIITDVDMLPNDKARQLTEIRDRLETLHKSLEFKPEEFVDKLRTEFDAEIRQLKNDLMTDEQRQALIDKQKLEHDKKLLDYSFENVSQRNEFRDVRNVNKETPVKELKLVRPNIHRQFAQNKTNT